MADEVRLETVSGIESPVERPGYEPPTVTLIGNARDLLAGAGGTLSENPGGPAIGCGNMSRSPSDGC